jgi:hypothetical protein
MLFMESGVRLKEKKYRPSDEEMAVPHPGETEGEHMDKKAAEYEADYADVQNGTSEWLANQDKWNKRSK